MFKINLDKSRRSGSQGEKSIALQVTLLITIEVLTQNFNKAFKNLSKKNKKFDEAKKFTKNKDK